MLFSSELNTILIYIVYMVSIVIHLLVIAKIIPFTVVNGGRSVSYDIQLKLSKQSVLVLLFIFIVVIMSSLFPAFKKTIVYIILMILLSLFWLLGTILQILGTKWERYGIIWINLLGLITHLNLLIEYFLKGE